MVNKPTKELEKQQRDSRSPSPEFDPQAFQASLDQSVNAARELVSSWIPQDFGGGSSNANGFAGGASGSSSVQTLKDKARPPRMGLGAQPALIHKQQAEDRKLKERLLGKGRKSMGDEGSTVTSAVENKDGADGEASESEDEEDSRSRVIAKGKGKSNGTTSAPVKNAPNNPFVTNSKNVAAAPQKKPETPLFNDPSPSKPSTSKPSSSSKPATTAPETSKSATSNRTIAPVSFYPKDAPSSAPPPAALSKNQRKKLRKQEREQEVKEKLQAESRQEEEVERKRAKRSRDEDGEDNEGETLAQGESQDIEMGQSPSEKSAQSGKGDVNGAGSKKKKKKKGKVGTVTEAPPLLNL